MKKLILVFTLSLLFSCAKKGPEDPLILPPNFVEMPDPNNPEKPTQQQKDADIEKLKDLLLKSE